MLVLTPTRLIYSHTDENPAEEPGARPQAETSTEAVRFSRISSVAVTRVFADPASYVPGVTSPSEVVLTIGWNVLSHVELEPAHCGDESCDADHGYSGTIKLLVGIGYSEPAAHLVPYRRLQTVRGQIRNAHGIGRDEGGPGGREERV